MISELKETELGEICKDWNVKNLDEVCSEIIDCLHAKKPELLDKGKYSYIDVKNIDIDGKIDLRELKYISKGDFLKWTSRLRPQKKDIIITKTGRVGAVAMIPDDLNCCIGRNQVILRADSHLINPYFLFYFFLSPYFKIILKKLTLSGTILDSLHVKNIPKIKLPFPEIDEQQRIVKILFPIFRKIEINFQMIKTLKKIAFSLFKLWFIDFEPFKNNGLMDSELGKIPKGWKINIIKNVGKVITGKTPSTKVPEYYGRYIRFIKTPDMENQIFCVEVKNYLSKKGERSQSNKTVTPNTIIVNCIGARAGFVSIVSENSQFNQQINGLILNDYYLREFMYFTLKTLRPTLRSFGSTGSTMINCNKNSFENLKFIYPSDDAILKYHRICKSIFEMILVNTKANFQLKKIKKILLKQLMSGKLRIEEPEEVLEGIENEDY